MQRKNIIIGIIIIIGIAISIPLLLSKKSNNVVMSQLTEDTDTDTDEEVVEVVPEKLIKYIAPMNFEVGLMKVDKCQFANNTNPEVLYPINGLSPDYDSKMPEYSPCMEFIQSP